MKKIFLVVFLLIGFLTWSQHGYRDGNRIGIYGGVTHTSLFTSNFDTKPELGWAAGMQVRGNYYNNFSMIFGMQFSENNISVATVSPLLQKQEVKYKVMGAQIRLLLSYNLIKNHMSLDFGPVLQVNDKLKFDSKYKENLISGTALTTEQITGINKINGNLYAGITAGNSRVRAIISYQFGANNILNNLNKKEELKTLNGGEFKGNLGILSGQLLFNL